MTFDDFVDTNLHLLELKLIASLAPQEAHRLAVLLFGGENDKNEKKTGKIGLFTFLHPTMFFFFFCIFYI